MKRRSSHKRHWKDGGNWLQQLRCKAEIPQADLAGRLGIKYYSYISQIENGISRMPIDKFERWAIELGVDPTDFAERLVSFYEPELHRLLYRRKRERGSHGEDPG